jgi:CBS domain-containing protein
MKASDVMTRTVTCIDEQASIAQALQLMLGKAIGGLPVINCNQQLVGIVTEGDLLRRAELASQRHIAWLKNLIFGPWFSAKEYVHTHPRSVSSIMTREILCISEDTPLSTIVRIMDQGQVKRLPVTKEGKVIGIVSRRDVRRPLSSTAVEPPAKPASDADILAQIDARLAAQRWSPLRNIEINAKHGIVTLVGTVSSSTLREALLVLVRNVPGVRDIKDELMTLPPNATARA